MPADDSQDRWVSDRTGLTILAGVSALLALVVVLPYLQYVLLGLVLAYIFMPVQRRVEEYLPRGWAALVVVSLTVLVVLIPVVFLLTIAFQEALEVINTVRSGTLDVGGLEQQLETVGFNVDIVDLYLTYEASIRSGVQGLALGTLAIGRGLPGVMIGLTVTLFVHYALLRDRLTLLAWVRRVLPVREDLQDEMFAQLDQLMWASVVGNVAVAAVQAILLGFGLTALGVPAVAFLTVTTFVFALLPLIGAFAVWIPVSIYLFAIGRPVAATILVLYGTFVSASDMYLRPALIGRTSAFNAAIIVVGIFGGLVVFGAVGLFIGPVVLGGAKITLDVFSREREASEAVDDTVPDAVPAADDPVFANASNTTTASPPTRESAEAVEPRGDVDSEADGSPPADDRTADTDRSADEPRSEPGDDSPDDTTPST